MKRIGLVLHPRRDCSPSVGQVLAWTASHGVELVASTDDVTRLGVPGLVAVPVEEAVEAGLPHRVVEYALGNVSGASLFADGYTGTAIAVVDTEREVLLGVTFIGPGVAEMLQAATIAVVGEVPISRLWHAVPAYPTMNEIWLRLLETYRG